MTEHKQSVLTGITPSGTPHLGNYIGAIKPALALAEQPHYQARYFIADYHSLVKLWSPAIRQQYIYEGAATWLALGLDPEHTIFYRQSAIPEIMELNWILGTVAAKGLLNRAHAYKAMVDSNYAEATDGMPRDPDAGITMGLFNYPVLMAADILLFDTERVPVGKDQIQHVEIARDIANRLNHIYQQPLLTPPEALVDDSHHTLPGLDGRKMSKSYNNTIPLFAPAKKLRKLIMKIRTNSQGPDEPKDPQPCPIFNLYRHFASDTEVQALAERYRGGIGWGTAKQILFETIDAQVSEAREHYNALIADRSQLDRILARGAEQARDLAAPKLAAIRKAIGI